MRGSKLDTIATQLADGDKNALYKIAPYLDSTRIMIERLGYHRLETRQQDLVERSLEECCSFFSRDLKYEQLAAHDLLSFLNTNWDKIIYDNDAGVFLITPFKDRRAAYQIQQLTPVKKQELANNAAKLLQKDWVQKSDIANLINSKDPLALYKIAASLYKGRNRFDSYQSDAKEHILLLELLTGVSIATENEEHKLTNFIYDDYYPNSRLNLLIYFAQHYQHYKWDDRSGTFTDADEAVKPTTDIAAYFELLSSEKDSIAMDAFIKLTTCDPKKVSALAYEYKKANTSTNRSLTPFPYDFLKRLSALTNYCKANIINFTCSGVMRKNIEVLKRNDLSFAARRKIEEQLIRSMTINDVTALEYWRSVYVQQNRLNYSAARVLDVFYTNHWQQVIQNKKQLDLYLKKCLLLDSLGGVVYTKYITKFVGADNRTISMLKQNRSADKEIAAQTKKAIAMALKKPGKPNASKAVWTGNYDAEVKDLEKAFNDTLKKVTDPENKDRAICDLYSKINYNQISIALKLVDTVQFKYKWYKYTFIERDFGFFNIDFEDTAARKSFLNYYLDHTEWEVYAHCLAMAGINYQNPDHSLNYDKIYELLKYDVVGGYEQEGYLLIKLLELKFKTTLGFPVKLCNSNGTYGCNSTDRAKVWMAYLNDNHLLKRKHFKIISFSY